MVPIFQCFFILFAVISGGVYFNEFAGMDTLQLVMFAAGVVVTISGVVLLASSQAKQAAEQLAEEDEESAFTELEPDSPQLRHRPSVWDRIDVDVPNGGLQRQHSSSTIHRNTSVWAPAPFLQIRN